MNVKFFKPSKRVFKSLGKEVVSVGFPKSSFEKYMKGFEFIVDSGGEIAYNVRLRGVQSMEKIGCPKAFIRRFHRFRDKEKLAVDEKKTILWF